MNASHRIGLSLTLLVSFVGVSAATADEFIVRMIVLDANNPGPVNRLVSARQARDILNGTITDAHIAEDIMATVDVIDFGRPNTGHFDVDHPYPNGIHDDSLSNFAIQVRGMLEIPAGSWSIGLNSDDGGYIYMPNVQFEATAEEQGANGTIGEVIFDGGRGAWPWTRGMFTVPEGEVLQTSFEALIFEGGGGDSMEVAILDRFADVQNDLTDFGKLLGDGVFGWKVSGGSPAGPCEPDTLGDINRQWNRRLRRLSDLVRELWRTIARSCWWRH